MADDDFSEPPRRADSKNPIFIFCRIFGSGSPPGPGGQLVGLGGGGRQLSPCARGCLARGLYRPPHPGKRKPSHPSHGGRVCFGATDAHVKCRCLPPGGTPEMVSVRPPARVRGVFRRVRLYFRRRFSGSFAGSSLDGFEAVNRLESVRRWGRGMVSDKLTVI